MGAGKSSQAITTLSVLHRDGADAPSLIITKKGIKRTWLDEFRMWAPELRVVNVAGSAPQREKLLASDADVFVAHWDVLTAHSRLAPYGSIRLSEKEKTPGSLNRPWHVVVADEVHRAKDPKAKWTRALWAIRDSALHAYGLTGTPVEQSPTDFWALLRFVSPDEWPSKSKFIDRYCLTAWNAFGGMDVVGLHPHRQDEFFAIADRRFLRRPKSLVLPYLPEKVFTRRYAEMTPKQAKAYKDLRDGMYTDLDGQPLIATDPLALNVRLTQFASASASIDEDGKVRLCEPSNKVNELMELVEDLGDEPFVVFAESRQLIELAAARLEKAGVPFGLITGAQDEEERDKAKHAFQSGWLRALLLTYGAGAEGITLTRARVLIRLERSWSLTKNQQAIDRIHRPGAEQHESLSIIDIVAPSTIEEPQLDALDDKAETAEEINRDHQAMEFMP